MHDRHHDHDEPPAPFTVDEYLGAADLPDPNQCPYCANSMQEVDTAIRWQSITLRHDHNGELDIYDYGRQESEGDGREYYIECRGAQHSFGDLDELDAEQREQHALALLTDEPGAHGEAPPSEHLRAIYARPADWSDAPTFAGRRSRMARAERRERYHHHSIYQARERFARYFTQPEPTTEPAIETERELAAAGIL